MPKTQKFINWVNVPIPETYYKQVSNHLKETREYASIAEYVREAVREKLMNDLGLHK